MSLLFSFPLTCMSASVKGFFLSLLHVFVLCGLIFTCGGGKEGREKTKHRSNQWHTSMFFFFWRNSKTLLESQFLQSHIFTCIFCVLLSFSLFSLTLFVIPFRWHWWNQRRSSRTDQCQSSRMEGRRKSWYCSRGKECDCSLSHSLCDQQVNNIVKTCTLKTSALPVTAVNLPSC